MRYRVVGRGAAVLTMLAVLLAGGLGLAGVRQAALQAAASVRSLPIYSVETDKKQVALGINCAWGDQDIPRILETLEQYQVTATFFLVGDWCDRFPQRVQQLAESGQELGNHSDTHADLSALSWEGITAELEQCSDKIEALTGRRPELFRPPSGAYNDLVVDTARSLDYEVIQWDCDTLDWKGLTPEQIRGRVAERLQNGSILLLHSDTAYTAEVLPELIVDIQDRGYQIVPVGELIYRGAYRIDHTGRQWREEEAED